MLDRTPKKTSLTLLTCVVITILFSCNKITTETSVSAHQQSQFTNLSRPNIIFILGDDIGFEIPTVDGGQSYQTPNIDAMAYNGMRFTQCFTAPLCSPSRFMLMSGKYNYRNYTAWGRMNPNEKTIATLLHDAGYATYVAGKWQFDGGDASIHSLGFDGYNVWNPYEDSLLGSHYKNPVIYEHGEYVPGSLTRNKYGDDIFTDSALQFIKANSDRNFFVYFPITLCHDPFSPTPDDPQFRFWDPKRSASDTTYFPSMVQYMDKKIGQVYDSLKAWNLYDNTIVIFAGDNGTPGPIISKYNGHLQIGGKAQSTIFGIRVPMMITWPGHIAANTVNNNIIDFVDFLPTFADAAGTSVSTDYGTIDGVSFYNQLIGVQATPRAWSYCYYHPLSKEGGNTNLKIWAQNGVYKLYDSLNTFYNVVKDPYELSPLTTLTPKQQKIKDQLQAVIDSEHN